MILYFHRLKSVREIKVKHTIEKRNQNGYTDFDDLAVKVTGFTVYSANILPKFGQSVVGGFSEGI